MNYVNYHRHDFYSNLMVSDSTVSPEDYAKRATGLNQTILSSVNHGFPSRYIEHHELAKQYNLKFLFGVEAYIVKDRIEKDRTNAHIILLAKNEFGRKAINRILSEANLTGFYYRPRIDMELLLSLPKDDIWVTTACLAGIWQYENYEELILKISKHFGKNFFLEVQYHHTESQAELNKKIIDLSNKHNIGIVFGTDSHYIYPDQAQERDDYLLSKHISYENEEGWFLDYPSCDEAIKRFQKQGVLNKYQIKEAINNTNIFNEVEQYDSIVFNTNIKLPSIYPHLIQEDKNKKLTDLIWLKWDEEKNNVSQNKWDTYKKEIEKELSIIVETNMADYFLLDYEIIKKGKELGGHLTQTGRGSGPSFYTAKLLDFTTIDRISAKVKLFPERFMTKERILETGSLPDFDFNIGNPEIFAQAQTEIMGANHSYPMVAYGTLRPKAAWKLYARATNIDFETANNVSEEIGKYEKEVLYAEDGEEDFISISDFIGKEYIDSYNESTKYLGVVAQASVHPCAWLLLNQNIKEEIGLIRIKDHICCLMDGKWAEEYSFLKNDLLKVNVVELIHRVYKRINIEPHTLPKLIEICKDNKNVWDVYANAWTMGINQVEKSTTSGRAAKYKPTNISELSAFVASIRPGFKSNYRQFESREQFSYDIPSLDSIIQTKEFPQSYLLYQENAMSVLAYAGIPVNETYDIVKNIAKKRYDKIFKYKDIFLSGMTEKIISLENKTREESNRIAHMTWQVVEDSSRYSFNSSHAYSVAGDSLYGAYLKSHYPVEFYEVLMSILEESGDKNRLAKVVSEAERAYGIKFPRFRFGQDNRYIKGNSQKKEITASLKTIKGFGNKIGESLYLLGQNHYDSFLDFLIDAEEKGHKSKKYESLIKIHYFNMFGGNLKLLKIYNEFTSGKNRYSKKHADKTKEKRIVALREFSNNIKDEKIPIIEQILSDQEILGYINTIYPNIDKRYIVVQSLNLKFAPRIDAYCLYNGKTVSLKIYKKTYENNYFLGGDILFCNNFEKKAPVKFKNGEYLEDLSAPPQYWLLDYDIISSEDFDKRINIT